MSTSSKKPSSTEEEYFALEEAQRRKLAKLKEDQATEEAARQARIGTCPGGCATKLVEESFQTIRVDRCPTCGGVWLDPGEIDQIAPDNTGLLRSAFQFFAGKSPAKL
jgi:uncharacterized protein